jgi:hypothetical protein
MNFFLLYFISTSQNSMVLYDVKLNKVQNSILNLETNYNAD